MGIGVASVGIVRVVRSSEKLLFDAVFREEQEYTHQRQKNRGE